MAQIGGADPKMTPDVYARVSPSKTDYSPLLGKYPTRPAVDRE
jgi:hypothetical protein